METKKKRTRAEAKKLMWEYYRDNKGFLPSSIRECRDEILGRLIDGRDPAVAFDLIQGNVETSTSAQHSIWQAKNLKVAICP